jgi:site-specific DNA recombinase
MKRAGLYSRKSTEQNVADEAKSVAVQERGARAFCAQRGWEVAVAYADDGVSGAVFKDRPGLQKLLRAAEAKAFDVVVVHSLDRLGRDTEKTRETLYSLAALGIEVWAYSTGRAVDMDSFEGGIVADMETRLGQWFRDTIRKKTRDKMRTKAENGEWNTFAPYGYRNAEEEDERGRKRKVLLIDEAQAEIVREIYRRFAAGQDVAPIQRWLNGDGVKPPRGNSGWSGTTLRALLRFELYRGEMVWGKTRNVVGRAAGKGREQAMVPVPEEEWVRAPRPDLRLVDEATAAAVDAKLARGREAYFAGLKAGRAPHKGGGRGSHLLSGGMLVCPDCGASFMARRDKYMCATRKISPGKCPNRLSLHIEWTDAAVLNALEGEVLGERYISELLSLVESGPADEGERLEAERDRLRGEINNLVRAVAKGMPAETIAPVVREYEAAIAKIDVALARPRPAAIDRAKLRAALEQRTKEWRAALRAEPEVARVMLRRLIGPITLWREEPVPEFMRKDNPKEGKENIGMGDVVLWGADIKPEALAEGLL